jgi:hypothetical protein
LRRSSPDGWPARPSGRHGRHPPRRRQRQYRLGPRRPGRGGRFSGFATDTVYRNRTEVRPSRWRGASRPCRCRGWAGRAARRCGYGTPAA